PNFVQLYDHAEQNDLSYFAREFVDGRSLKEMVLEPHALAHQADDDERVREVAELVETLARAVQAIHALGMLHGGLTPANVRVTPAGAPKITSFQRTRLPARDSDRTPLEREISYRAAYLAPEQLEGNYRALAPATDVYALGAILYTLLTGRPPFLGPTLP